MEELFWQVGPSRAHKRPEGAGMVPARMSHPRPYGAAREWLPATWRSPCPRQEHGEDNGDLLVADALALDVEFKVCWKKDNSSRRKVSNKSFPFALLRFQLLMQVSIVLLYSTVFQWC